MSLSLSLTVSLCYFKFSGNPQKNGKITCGLHSLLSSSVPCFLCSTRLACTILHRHLLVLRHHLMRRIHHTWGWLLLSILLLHHLHWSRMYCSIYGSTHVVHATIHPTLHANIYGWHASLVPLFATRLVPLLGSWSFFALQLPVLVKVHLKRLHIVFKSKGTHCPQQIITIYSLSLFSLALVRSLTCKIRQGHNLHSLCLGKSSWPLLCQWWNLHPPKNSTFLSYVISYLTVLLKSACIPKHTPLDFQVSGDAAPQSSQFLDTEDWQNPWEKRLKDEFLWKRRKEELHTSQTSLGPGSCLPRTHQSSKFPVF